MEKILSRLRSANATKAAIFSFIFILILFFLSFSVSAETGYNIPVDLNNLTPTSLDGSIIFSTGYGSLTKRGELQETGPSSNFPIARFYKYQPFTIDSDYSDGGWFINKLTFEITYTLPIDVDWSDAYIGFTFMSSMRFNQKVYATPADCYIVVGGQKFDFNSVQTDANTNNYYTFLVKDAPYSGNSISIFVEYDWNGGYQYDLTEGFDFCFQSSEALISTELTLEGSFLQKIWQEIGGLSEGIGNEIKDAFQEIEDKDQAASDKSQEDINNALNSGPADNAISALGGLVSALGNQQQQFSITFPEIYIPSIPGVVEQHSITQSQTFDFQSVIDIIPPVILELVRNLLAVGVMLFAIKDMYELYLQILDSYKGGSK